MPLKYYLVFDSYFSNAFNLIRLVYTFEQLIYWSIQLDVIDKTVEQKGFEKGKFVLQKWQTNYQANPQRVRPCCYYFIQRNK